MHLTSDVIVGILAHGHGSAASDGGGGSKGPERGGGAARGLTRRRSPDIPSIPRRRNPKSIKQREHRTISYRQRAHYAALKTIESARGRPQLVGLLSDGGEVAVPVMSDGARDQLYLALRLAALDSYLEHNPPLPLIADDLFIHFDTDRAAAAFDILGELAAKTQTLFFTHHDHLARLAVETLGPERVERHDLGVRATD